MWRSRDPLRRFRLYLENRGLWDDHKEAALIAQVKKTVASAVETFESQTDFALDAPFDHVFGTVGDSLCIDNMEYCKENHDDDRCYQRQRHCYTDKDVIR